VDFDTTRAVYTTSRDKCHISHVVLDSNWEAKLAETLEEMDEVICYVKNQGLGFTIPYTFNGEEHGYLPDYIVRIRPSSPTLPPSAAQTGEGSWLNLILEVSGEARKDKAAKVATARNLWVPAINNHGGFGRWAFIEITDPWDAKNTIRAMLRSENVDGVGPLVRMAR
jgi:type III restriction enzyme